MHHIYHTEGIILGSRNFGEAGRYYSIFTKELGMIHASAQGVRKLSSKLRYVMQDYSYIKVDLVRGKDFWRVTSASSTGELSDILKSYETYKIISNVSRLLVRLLHGEEQNEPLFNDLLGGFYLLEQKADNKEDLLNAEMILVLRALHHLGYFSGDARLVSLVGSSWGDDMLPVAGSSRPLILAEINKALGETQM